MGSTHGTYVNKKLLQPKIYHKLNVGDIFKLGTSSRMLILSGPEELIQNADGVRNWYLIICQNEKIGKVRIVSKRQTKEALFKTRVATIEKIDRMRKERERKNA
jgi:pSer/pThr/pTyr-binding forkhead associated (FHA) protein